MKINVEKIDTFTGHRDCVYTLEKGTAPHLFYSAAGDGLVVEWNLKSPDLGKPIAQLNNSVYALLNDNEKNELWVAQNTEGIHILTTQKKEIVKSIPIAAKSIFDLKQKYQQVWVATSEGILYRIDKNTYQIESLWIANSSIRALDFHPNLPILAAATSDNTIVIINTATFLIEKVIEGHTNSVFTLKFIPDTHFLVSGGRDATLRKWDMQQNYKEIQRINAHLFAINSIAFHPTLPYFATASMDKSIKVWDAENLKLLKVIDRARHAGHGTSINKLLWSEYENQLISASDDRTISSWNVNFLP